MKQQMNAVIKPVGHWLQVSPRAQRGAATILTMLLIGVGLISVSLGAMHMVRSTQERQLAAHAQVNSQAGVWATVETVRTYLQTLTKEQLTTLNDNQTWTITGNDNLAQQAVILKTVLPVAPATAFKIRAHLSATDISARSSSSLEVVYEVTPGVAPQAFELKGVLDFYNTLELSGGITLNIPGNDANFNVDGDFIATGVGIGGANPSDNPLNRIAVTGNVVISSAVKADELWGRNVSLLGGSGVKNIRAFGDPDGTGTMNSTSKTDTCCGNVLITGGTGAEDIQANGSVELNGGSAVTVNARRDVVIKGGGGGAYNSITARNITAEVGASISKAAATVDIWYKQFVTPVGSSPQTMTAIGNIRCGTDAQKHEWYTYGRIDAGGTITDCTSSNRRALLTPAPDVQLIEPLPPITLTRPKVDAWSLKPSANYAIEIVGSNIKVTVKNVNGIANGSYFLARNSGQGVSQREYLCKTVDSSGYCVTPVKPFCSGVSPMNSCFSQEVIGGQNYLNVKGGTLPPGVIWVKGNFKIELGNFYNTFVVTGDLFTGGSVKTYSVNFAAAYKTSGGTVQNAICKNEADSTIKEALFNGMYPTNYCVNGQFIPNALGNIALLAGGYEPDNNGIPRSIYSGGLIELGAANQIYGTVVSGNLLKTGGSTFIAGYISAAGLQLAEGDKNQLTGSTTIDLTNLPDTYKPNEIPDMSGGGAGQTAEARVLWTRYL